MGGQAAQRDERRIVRLLRQSGLPPEKTFRTLELVGHFPPAVRQQVERLRGSAFVDEAVNVLAMGRAGTGKSHLATALGHELVRRGHRVFWTPKLQDWRRAQ